MMGKVSDAFKARPLFYVFVFVFCIVFLITQIYTDIVLKHNENIKVSEISGEIFKEPWCGADNLVFYGKINGKKEKILVNIKNVPDNVVEKYVRAGKASLNNVSFKKQGTDGNYYAFDYCKYLKSHRVTYTLFATKDDFKDCEERIFHGFQYYSWRARSMIQETLGKYFSEETSGIVMSVMTGDTGELENESKNLLARAGFSHLIAVSGAHIAFVSKPFAIAVRRSMMRLGKRNAVMLIPVILLWFIAGASASVTRAAIMCIAVTIGAIIKRKPDGLNSLGTAGIIQLIANPFSVFSTGFLLSYGSTMAILIIMPVFKNRIKTRSRIVGGILPGIAVNLGILPITLYLFNSFSICGILLNMFAAEIASIICVGGYAVFLLDKLVITRPLLKLCSNGLVSLSKGFEWLSGKIGGGNSWFFRIETKTPSLWFMILYYSVLTLILLAMSGKKFGIPIATGAIALGLIIYGGFTQRIEVLIFDVG